MPGLSLQSTMPRPETTEAAALRVTRASLEALALKVGQVLDAKVLGASSNGLTQLSIAGQLLSVKLSLPLPAGTQLQIQVQAGGPQGPPVLVAQTPAIPAAMAPPRPAAVLPLPLPQVTTPAPAAGPQPLLTSASQPAVTAAAPAPAQTLPAPWTQTAPQPAAPAPLLPTPGTTGQPLPPSGGAAQPPGAAQPVPASMLSGAGPAPVAVAMSPAPAISAPAAPVTLAPPSPAPAPPAQTSGAPAQIQAPVQVQTPPAPATPAATQASTSASAGAPNLAPASAGTLAAPAPAGPLTTALAAAPAPAQPTPLAQGAAPLSPAPVAPNATPQIQQAAQPLGSAPTTTTAHPSASAPATQQSPATAMPIRAAPSSAPPAPPVAGSVAQVNLSQATQAAARQDSMAPLLQNLSALQGRLAEFPRPVVEVTLRLLAGRLNLDRGAPSGEGLKQAVQRSGIFLEALTRPGAGQPPAPGDVKAALLQLRGALTAWLGDDIGPVAPVARRPQPPTRGAQPRGQRSEAPNLPEAALPKETGRALLGQTEAALSRLRLQQLASLPPDAARVAAPAAAAEWNLEIPLLLGQELAMAQLQISRDGKGKNERRERGWRMVFSLNFSALGEVGAQVSLFGQSASVLIWAEEDETAAALTEMLPELTPALAAKGLAVGSVRVRQGRPKGAQPQSGQLLDSVR